MWRSMRFFSLQKLYFHYLLIEYLTFGFNLSDFKNKGNVKIQVVGKCCKI